MRPGPARGYGWRPDVPDQRDRRFMAVAPSVALPAVVDLRAHCPAVYDQGALGSCTAQAIAAAVAFDRRRLGLEDWTPSRLFVYYNERRIEGTIASDAGATLRDGIKSVNRWGAPRETVWPYRIPKFATRPPSTVYSEGAKHPVLQYARVTATIADLRGCLAAGYPFVFGFTVYESFESEAVARSGVVPMPEASERVLGGHAVLGVGYDHSSQRFLVRNSWGSSWGQQGYYTMPYAYLTNSDLADDFWTIRLVK